MINFNSLFIITILLSCIKLFNSQISLEEKSLKFIKSYSQLVEKLEQHPNHLSLMVISRSEGCVNCVAFHEEYERYLQFTEFVVKSYILDCKEMWKRTHERTQLKICDPDNIDKLPLVRFYKPQKRTYNPYDENQTYPFPQEIDYKEEMEAEYLVGFARAIMPDYTTPLENIEQVNTFKNDTSIPLKIYHFTDYQDVTHDWKGLSSEFRLRVDIGIISENCTELVEHFEVEQSPTIILEKWEKKTQEYRRIQYKGAQRFESLRAFLNRYALTQPKKIHFSKYDEKINEEVKVQFDLNKFEEDLKKESETWVLLQIKKTGEKDHPKYSSIKQKYGNFFQYYEIKCDDNDDIFCSENINQALNIKKWPAILIYPFGKKTLTNFIEISKEDTAENLAHTLIDYINIPEKEMDDRQIQKYMEQSYSENKLLIVWFYYTSSENDFINLQIHTISNIKKFQQYLNFGKYTNPNENTTKLYGLETFPNALGFAGNYYEEDDVRKVRPKQKIVNIEDPENFNYDKLYKFTSELSELKEAEILESQKAQQVDTMEEFEKKCVKNGNPCFIGLINPVNKSQLKLDTKQLDASMQHLRAKKYNWLWIDGFCHQEVMAQLNMKQEDLPFLVYYDSKKEKIKIMSEVDFVSQNILVFEKRLTTRKKKGLKPLDGGLELEERNCQQKLQNQRKLLKQRREEMKKLKLEKELELEQEQDQEQQNIIEDL